MQNLEQTTSCPPILFLIFNRPDLTQRVFACIREARPGILFVAADGPRSDHPGEEQICAVTRRVVDQVDWPCEVHTLFRNQNLGCKMAVSGAINWFFEHLEEGIILEDDCLPHPTFFRFCAELLEHYRDDKHIMMISGDNFQDGNRCTPNSYYFSKHVHIWGWASWRRSWMHYDDNLDRWPAVRETNWLRKTFQDKHLSQYWRAIFDRLYQKSSMDTWCYYWMYSIWNQNGLCVIPAVNLVSNIGFDQRGTHTVNENDRMANRSTGVITFPLNHPHDIVQNVKADRYTSTHALAIQPLSIWPLRVIRKLKQIFLSRNGTQKLINSLRYMSDVLKDRIYWTRFLSAFSYERLELDRINRMPRYQQGTTDFLGHSISFVDSATFLNGYREIFQKEVYRFRASLQTPVIIDCGTNIGLSIIFFKSLYPMATILGFEPDPNIFEVCSENIRSFGLTDIVLYPQAVWIQDTQMDFSVEGGFSGRLAKPGDQNELISVPTRRLRSLLDRRIDFLKIDIEGAEHQVLMDCADLLHNVENIFVEYHSHFREKQQLHELLEVLTEAGFRYHIHEAYTMKNPYIDRALMLGMDLQLNIYGFRIRC